MASTGPDTLFDTCTYLGVGMQDHIQTDAHSAFTEPWPDPPARPPAPMEGQTTLTEREEES